ncbi:MAG: MATE family efflux transporter, partial [Muribaculaceae bacterium]|nr:MATE family efflux transporter [Muribaculaceae bacterium]
NNSLLKYGGDDAIASVVVFNRFVTIFVFIVMGICQGMQPILGYNYGSGRFDRLFRTLWLAAGTAVVVTTTGSLIGAFNPRTIAAMFMQDEQQINCAVNCLKITTMGFWMVGLQVVSTNFFQSLGMATKAVFLSLTRQILFMIPLLFILPPRFGLNGVWACYPICDCVAAIVATCMLLWQVRHIKRMGNRLNRLHTELAEESSITPKN